MVKFYSDSAKFFRLGCNINKLAGEPESLEQIRIATGSVVAIGNFDGIHLGHQKVLQTAVDKAKELSAISSDEASAGDGDTDTSHVYTNKNDKGGECIHSSSLPVPAIMLTFQPHPKKIFFADKKARLAKAAPAQADLVMPSPITPFAEKCRLARENSIDAIYAIRFSREYAKTSAEQFVRETLAEILNAKVVVVGDDFCFGKGREGSIETLTELGFQYGFELISVPQVINAKGERYSSTILREALANGDIQRAYELTGRYYSIRTDMVEDDNLNLTGKIKHYTMLKNGVYWAKISYTACLDGGRPPSDSMYTNKQGGVVPVVIKDGRFLIKPLPTLPDLPEGRVKIEFLKQLSG